MNCLRIVGIFRWIISNLGIIFFFFAFVYYLFCAARYITFVTMFRKRHIKYFHNKRHIILANTDKTKTRIDFPFKTHFDIPFKLFYGRQCRNEIFFNRTFHYLIRNFGVNANNLFVLFIFAAAETYCVALNREKHGMRMKINYGIITYGIITYGIIASIGIRVVFRTIRNQDRGIGSCVYYHITATTKRNIRQYRFIFTYNICFRTLLVFWEIG